MKISILSFLAITVLIFSALSVSSCSENNPTATPETEATEQITNLPQNTEELTQMNTPTETTQFPTEEETYEFPDDGVLSLANEGIDIYPDELQKRNPAIIGSNIVLFFSYADKKAGLDLDENNEITYTLKKGSVSESRTVRLDSVSCPQIKNSYGYIGLCFPVEMTFGKYENATLNLSFKDKSGKEYKLVNKSIYHGITYEGITYELLSDTADGVTTEIKKNIFVQQGDVGGNVFTLTVNLALWDGNTTPNQIATLAKLFWDCYPQMYMRFSGIAQSPKNVTIAIENSGYEIASAGGNSIHLHDKWLYENKKDYDCITHELAHVIQNGWDGDYCEYSDYIERFADYCRFVYAYNDGFYNDGIWTLQTLNEEGTREKSVRFLVWLDYNYGSGEKDIILDFFSACYSRKYSAENWSEAWKMIFEGTELEGKNADQVFELYAKSDFAKLSTKRVIANIPSPFLKEYDVRNIIKNR